VYLSSQPNRPDAEVEEPLLQQEQQQQLRQPALVKLPDYRDRRVGETAQERFQHQGLVQSLSETDLANTDVYIFRESTGQLLAERQGLGDAEVRSINRTQVGGQRFQFQTALRGPQDNRSSSDGFGTDSKRRQWSDWASSTRMDESLQQQRSPIQQPRTPGPHRFVRVFNHPFVRQQRCAKRLVGMDV
jgi:hypothetical protein